MIERFRSQLRLPDEKVEVEPAIIKEHMKDDVLKQVARTITMHTEVRNCFREYKKPIGINPMYEDKDNVLELDLVVIDYESFNLILRLLNADSWPNASWEEFKILFKDYIEKNK